MNNDKGFSLIEMLFAMSIIMMLVATALPIHQLIQAEQQILKNRLTVQAALHDVLLDQLWQNEMITEKTLSIGIHTVKVTFNPKEGYIEGCAKWENEKDKTEILCLHGIRER